MYFVANFNHYGLIQKTTTIGKSIKRNLQRKILRCMATQFEQKYALWIFFSKVRKIWD